MGTAGIVANPASGKDVRRLVARASVFDNQEKQAIVRRVLAGLAASDPDCRIRYLDDAHGIVDGAVRELFGCADGAQVRAVMRADTRSALDTVAAGRALAAEGVDLVITLGGDGTNRALVCGWQCAPMLPISTGTNNVFPVLIEGTVAGAAAGLVTSGALRREDVCREQKIIHVDIEDEPPDVALVDAVLVAEQFVGSRALLDPDLFELAVLTRADPAAVGITSIGGLLAPLGQDEDAGMVIEMGGRGPVVRAPIAPGLYREVAVSSHRRVALDEDVEILGPGILAFDGERERVLGDGQRARLTVRRDGPLVLNPQAALSRAAETGAFVVRS